MGTRFLVTKESMAHEKTKLKVMSLTSEETARTRLWDVLRKLPWPEPYNARTIRNPFSEKWESKQSELTEKVTLHTTATLPLHWPSTCTLTSQYNTHTPHPLTLSDSDSHHTYSHTRTLAYTHTHSDHTYSHSHSHSHSHSLSLVPWLPLVLRCYGWVGMGSTPAAR